MTDAPKRGRPSVYTREVADEICRRLADGETLREVCRSDDFPLESTVRGWANDDREGFAAHYARSREIGYTRMEDELLEIVDDGSNDWMDRRRADGTLERVVDYEHIARSRLRADTRKWLLAKALPKRYGDKSSIELTGKDGAPLVQIYLPDNGRDVAKLPAPAVEGDA